MKTGIFMIAVVLIFTGWGCSPDKVTKSELMAYVHDPSNGLYKKAGNDDIILELVYRPTDLLVAQEIEGRKYKPKQIDSIRNHYNQFDYFTFKLSSNGNEATQALVTDTNQAIEYLSSGIEKKFNLVLPNDTVPVADFMYIPGSGRGNANVVLLAFRSYRIDHPETYSLVFEDNFFGTGITRFDFDPDNMKDLPSIELK